MSVVRWRYDPQDAPDEYGETEEQESPGCMEDECGQPAVYQDEWRALCGEHYPSALEQQGGASAGR